jgi:hypothetical protein
MRAGIRSALILLAISIAPVGSFADASLVVHEWGTFTSFQDAQGQTIAGINVDDEPVPAFVHRLKDLPVFTTTSLPALWSQGAPRCHSDVTLRLETPVIYFYPKAEMHGDTVDVRATFKGGWITEFYPRGDIEAADFPASLNSESRGSIKWRALRFGGSESSMPMTPEHVWLAPRQVSAATVATAGETEKYLFYRGVGHLDAPVIVQQHDQGLAISLRASIETLSMLPRMWLVRVQPDGRVRFRSLDAKTRSASMETPPEGDARSDIDELREQMRGALVAEGLYEDEARAMLETWRLSYFSSEGLRLFFLLPQAWTEERLPLAVSPAAAITRVMMGRIELISDSQRAALKNLYALSDADFPRQPLYFDEPGVTKPRGDPPRSHSDLYRAAGRPVPPALTQYEALGRFRDALLAHELRNTQDESKRARLRKVIDTFSACTPDSQEGGR